jgi:hypothetical protein
MRCARQDTRRQLVALEFGRQAVIGAGAKTRIVGEKRADPLRIDA